MKKSLFLFMLGLIAAWYSAFSQIAINTDSNAMVDIKNPAVTGNGILIPGMITALRTAIAARANGALVYDATTKSFGLYKRMGWTEIAGADN